MKKNTPEVQAFFNSNPKTDTLYFTTDKSANVLGLGFFKQTDAQTHANNLAKKNKTLGVVTTVTRAEAMVVDPAPVGVVVTQDMIDNDPTITARGYKVGDTLEEQAADVTEVGLAQKAFDDAVAGGDAPTIAAAKTALTNAKRKATMDAKKK